MNYELMNDDHKSQMIDHKSFSYILLKNITNQKYNTTQQHLYEANQILNN